MAVSSFSTSGGRDRLGQPQLHEQPDHQRREVDGEQEQAEPDRPRRLDRPHQHRRRLGGSAPPSASVRPPVPGPRPSPGGCGRGGRGCGGRVRLRGGLLGPDRRGGGDGQPGQTPQDHEGPCPGPPSPRPVDRGKVGIGYFSINGTDGRPAQSVSTGSPSRVEVSGVERRPCDRTTKTKARRHRHRRPRRCNGLRAIVSRFLLSDGKITLSTPPSSRLVLRPGPVRGRSGPPAGRSSRRADRRSDSAILGCSGPENSKR